MNSEHGKQPTIFLIEEDDETRTPLVQNLRHYGYRVIVTLDEEDALERVGGGHVRADLVLVNLIRKTAYECLAAGRKVRERAGFDRDTPLVATPESYGKELEGEIVNIEGNDWVYYLGEEPGQLQSLLARLTSSARTVG